MARIPAIVAFLLAAGIATSAWAQSNLEIPQTQSQNQMPLPTSTPHAVATPHAEQQSDNNTLQIAPVPTATPQQPSQGPPLQTMDPTAAAIAAAAAAAVNSLLVAQPNPAAPPPPPAPTPAPMAPSFNTQTVPALPSVFRGCWEGEVAMVDDLERLPGAHRVGYWTPKTYRLCYKRVGRGPFQLTFSQTGVVPNEQITNVRGRVNPLATDGRDYARLQSNLHFDEYHVTPGLRGTTFAVDEVTMLDCRISGSTMAVSANVRGTRDGAPWFKAKWHADFHAVPE